MNDSLRDQIGAYLAGHHSMTLATTVDGRPWAAAVFYVHDAKFRLYFLSDSKTRHCRELETNPVVAATVNEDPADWRDICGIQMEGRASRVNNPLEKARALTLYIGKFPFVRNFVASPLKVLSSMMIAGKVIPVTVYRLVPDRILYLDNRKGFSAREELIVKSVDRETPAHL